MKNGSATVHQPFLLTQWPATFSKAATCVPPLSDHYVFYFVHRKYKLYREGFTNPRLALGVRLNDMTIRRSHPAEVFDLLMIWIRERNITSKSTSMYTVAIPTRVGMLCASHTE